LTLLGPLTGLRLWLLKGALPELLAGDLTGLLLLFLDTFTGLLLIDLREGSLDELLWRPRESDLTGLALTLL